MKAGDLVKFNDPLVPMLGIVTQVCEARRMFEVLWADGEHWPHYTDEITERLEKRIITVSEK